jgi:hypothetical protein
LPTVVVGVGSVLSPGCPAWAGRTGEARNSARIAQDERGTLGRADDTSVPKKALKEPLESRRRGKGDLSQGVFATRGFVALWLGEVVGWPA